MSALRRAGTILRVIWRYGLYEALLALPPGGWRRPLQAVVRQLPRRPDSLAARTRIALETLGPVFIKFGQILSTRRDLLNAEFAAELSRLQDAVPPFTGARAAVEAGLERPLTSCFEHFEDTALASASVAQVHAARLADGTDVCVKVLRPDIGEQVRRDLRLLHRLAQLGNALTAEWRRLRLPEVVTDYEQTILAELDLAREAAATVRLRLNFADSTLLYVPRVYRELSSGSVLTLERITAAPLTDVPALRAAGTDMALLAERGLLTFFHPGVRAQFFPCRHAPRQHLCRYR